MIETKLERLVEVPAYIFEDNNGGDDYNYTDYSICIANGEIILVTHNEEPSGSYEKKQGDYQFAECCYNAIRFIVDGNPKELKNIYHALNEGYFKDFCKKVQEEKIAELQF